MTDITIKEYRAAYYQRNKDRILRECANRYAANRSACRETQAKWRKKNKEKIRLINAAYRATLDKDSLKKYKATWYLRNKQRISSKRVDYYLSHSTEIKLKVSDWRKANQDRASHNTGRYRAKKACNGGSHTLEQRKAKFALLGNVCYYCWEPKKLTVDHDIPISRGGTDDISNILPACKSCNSSKHDKTSTEFMFRKIA